MGLSGEDEMAATCGSTDTLVSLERTAVFSTRTLNLAYMDGETWLAASPMNATGAAVDWFVETFLGRGAKRYERYYELASSAPAGSGGVVFLPYLAGERSPVYDPKARGVFFGLTTETGLAETARAVLEGIGFGHRQILQAADVRQAKPVARVLASGGGVARAAARRIRVEAADRAYRFADLTDTSAFGAALLGGVAAEAFGSWREAASAARRQVRFEDAAPSREAWHRLTHNFEVYQSLYPALAHCF
jgi:xylulokinase